MKIAEIEAFAISIPIQEPVAFATRIVNEREHAIVYVRTEDGIEGLGYSLGYGGAQLIADAVTDILTPIVEGEDPRETKHLWKQMFNGTVQIGRKGLMLRAISCIDIALWDIKAKAAGIPLYKLLGGNTAEIPTYASGGYYKEEKGLEGLRQEMETYIERGHDAVKMKVGRDSLEQEIKRVKTVRETIGPNRTLMLDANGKWENKTEAVAACRAFSEYSPYFIEEPAMPDRIDLMARINDSISFSVAAGELEFNGYGFENLMSQNAVDIIQPDATVVGGVTEWMRVAHAASIRDIPVAPHYNWELHIQLLAAIDNSLWAEYFYRDRNVKVFDDVLTYTYEPNTDGNLHLPDRHGHGVKLDRDKVSEYKI